MSRPRPHSPAQPWAQQLARYSILTAPGAPIVLVTREPDREGRLTCEGAVLENRESVPCSQVQREPGDLADYRLTDEVSGLELICVQPGRGHLEFAGRRLAIRATALGAPS